MSITITTQGAERYTANQHRKNVNAVVAEQRAKLTKVGFFEAIGLAVLAGWRSVR